jgi:hypothetical protein
MHSSTSWEGTHRRGVLNLVFKRQSTCKISPLILYPAGQDRRGLGTILLQAAETEARKAGARHLYCTVAKNNIETLAFFLQLGFTVCGDAHEQYKAGETEMLLRRPLRNESKFASEDIISVSQVQDRATWSEVRDLLAQCLPNLVDGVTASWLESLYRNAQENVGWPETEGRRTWIYAAKDRANRYRAAAIPRYCGC